MPGALPMPGAARRAGRLASIDAYRGLVMLLMLAEVLRLSEVAAAFPGSRLWQFLAFHQTHVEWVGWSLHDLIMPSFGVLVGVALPYSVAGRQGRGDGTGRILGHAALRSVVLVALGIAIASAHPHRLTWSFADILPQVGLGYLALTVLALRPPREALLTLAVITAAYWLAFALFPLPGPGFEPESVGVSREWLAAHGLAGFEAHWQKNANLGWFVDTWFLNLFPQTEPFRYDTNGYVTLSFIPFLGTMIMGLAAGRELRSDRSRIATVRRIATAGCAVAMAGWLMAWLGMCPLVKRLWTPSWMLWSGGLAVVILAMFHLMVDTAGRKTLVVPLLVLGANSIAVYSLRNFHSAFAFHALARIVGNGPFRILGAPYEPLVYGGVTLAGYWTAMYVLYRKRIFLRI